VSRCSEVFPQQLRVQTIEAAWAICKRTGRQLPQHLVTQSDNTVAQAKNSFVTMMLAYLVSKYKFASTNLFFLMVGHTHEDIDQLFGVVCSLIQRKHHYEVPEDLMAFLQANLASKFTLKGEEFHVVRLTTVRDFAAWLAPLNITLSNAFANRDGIEAPHAFAFKLRRDLLPSERQWIQNPRRPGVQQSRRPGVQESDEDVMCCVKTYMRDTDLQQAPVVVLPADRRGRVASASPINIVPMHEMAPKTVEDLLLLAQTCDTELALPRAAQALHNLVRKRVYALPTDEWLARQCPPQPSLAAVGGNPFFAHLPESSWQLVARHR